ncbi:hypothetical protein [Ohtaekwangia sp.]|uniref:hypothetical protein n=1 Tax=Ohtaekwangia sp. TaxID=2066019 RepID=UPI002FDCF7AA
MKEFYRTDFVSVYYDENTDALWVKYFKKIPSDKHFIPVVDAMLTGFTSLQTQKFVADIRKMGILGTESQKLIVHKLLPGMIQHLKGEKLYHVQLIDHAEIMSKVCANKVKQMGQCDVKEIIQFSDENEVIKYMKSIVSRRVA